MKKNWNTLKKVFVSVAMVTAVIAFASGCKNASGGGGNTNSNAYFSGPLTATEQKIVGVWKDAANVSKWEFKSDRTAVLTSGGVSQGYNRSNYFSWGIENGDVKLAVDKNISSVVFIFTMNDANNPTQLTYNMVQLSK